MSSASRSPRRQRFLRSAHILAGLVIALHAYERWEHGHATYVLFAFASLVFLSLAMLHHAIARRHPWIDAVFIGIEALLSFTVMLELFAAGKRWLPFMYLLAGCVQLVAIRVSIRRSDRKGA